MTKSVKPVFEDGNTHNILSAVFCLKNLSGTLSLLTKCFHRIQAFIQR